MTQFQPKGPDRAKIAALKDEALLLLPKTPLAFCFVVRSMFEISAKVYAAQHSVPTVDKNNKDLTLAKLLQSITNHLTKGNPSMKKVLQGAITELAKPAGVLSITSLNQLIHHPTFSVQVPDICTLFGNIYPLLEAMN